MTLKLCLVLFRISMLQSFKSPQNIDFLWLNLYILNLLPTMKEDITVNQENFSKILAFSTCNMEILKYSRFLLTNYIPE